MREQSPMRLFFFILFALFLDMLAEKSNFAYDSTNAML